MLTFLFFIFLFYSGEVIGHGEEHQSIVSTPNEGEEVLFVVSAPGPLDRSLLARYGKVLEFNAQTALVMTTQASAERLSGEGMEIMRVMPPLRRRLETAPSLPRYTMGRFDPVIGRIIEEVVSSNIYNLLG